VGNLHISRDSGAGIQAAQLMTDKGAQFVVTGNCGPNAYQTLSAAGLGVIVGCSGTVRDVVKSFKEGRYSAAKQANVEDHFGAVPSLNAAPSATAGPPTPSSFAFGTGSGFGRGMGRGMGRGGALAGLNPDLQHRPTAQPPPDSTLEIAVLKARARVAEEQFAAPNEPVSQRPDATVPRLIAVVDVDQCTACGLCVQVCASGALTVNGVAKVDIAKCTACGQCVAQCPQGAITLRKA